MNDKTALLFPGQGSQYLNMHLKLKPETLSYMRKILEDINLSYVLDLMSVSEEAMLPTNVSQVAILCVSLGYLKELEDSKVSFGGCAGHSLGEYGALVAAGALSPRDALKIVSVRGELMGRCAKKNGGSMVALLGFERGSVEVLCTEASKFGVCVVANENSNQQTVISGEDSAINWALEHYKSFNIKRAVKLKVEGAFHSPLMQEAADEFFNVLKSVEFKDTTLDVYKNVDGKLYNKGDNFADILSRQIVSPVKWVSTIENIVANGYDSCIEVGPKNVLSTMLKRWTTLKCMALDGEQ